jgi:hypothetical protein
MIPSDLDEFDYVRVTGTVLSEADCHVVKLHGTVATLSMDGKIKIWPVNPDDPQLPPDCNGKLWFDRATVQIERA